MFTHVLTITWCCTVLAIRTFCIRYWVIHNTGIGAHCISNICFHIHTNLCSCIAESLTFTITSIDTVPKGHYHVFVGTIIWVNFNKLNKFTKSFYHWNNSSQPIKSWLITFIFILNITICICRATVYKINTNFDALSPDHPPLPLDHSS